MGKVIDFIKSNIMIIFLVIIVVAFVSFYIIKDEFNRKTTYTVVQGQIEHAEESNLYLIKKETIIDYDKSQPITAIVEQGKRASKYEAVAIYQNASYDDYLKQIDDIDKQLQTLVKDLPITYSADISNIEQKILKYSSDVQNTTSYLKMQEYKTKLDELAYRKIVVLSNSSPDSSAIRDLVTKREELVKLSKLSDNNIFAPVSGVIAYKIDSIEGKYNFNTVERMSAKDFENIIGTYDNNSVSEFGIKIIDNFSAYLLVKTQNKDNEQYINIGKTYKIRISDLENKTLNARLKVNIKEGEYNYSLFEIDNEIDDILDYRKLSCEVVWKTDSGMAIPLNSIHEDEIMHYKYVLMVYGTDYVKIPIRIITQSDSIAIVENVDKEEYKKYDLDDSFKLELYDELIIEQ